MIKFENLDDALNRLIRNIENSKKDYTLLATKEAERLLKARVFNVNGAKDISGSIVHSGYSEGYLKYNYWGKKKVAHNWDLHASGDLKDSIRVSTVSARKHTVLMFDNEREREIAGYIEDNSDKIIFKMSEKEKKQILKYVADEMIRDVRKIIKESFR